MKFLVIFLNIFIVITSCSNSNTELPKPVVGASKTDSLEAPSTKIPEKVVGAFLGKIPCTDCKLLDRFINLNEGDYIINEHHEGTKDKTKLLVHQNGKCTQDSGIISLYNNENISFQKYKIVALDTIQLLTKKAKQDAKPIYFIRKDGKKLVH